MSEANNTAKKVCDAMLAENAKRMLVDGHGPMTTRGCRHNPPPPAPQGSTHGTPPMHWEVVGQARLQPPTPVRVAAMSESNNSPQRVRVRVRVRER